MQNIWVSFAILVCMRILYLLELMPVRGGHRIGFIGSLCGERTRCNAAFTQCSGYMRRVVRLQGGKTYRFTMQGSISRGNLTAILWDKKCKTRLLELMPGESGTVELPATERCRLELRFTAATGKFTLFWEEA